jgi:hypothetical protein
MKKLFIIIISLSLFSTIYASTGSCTIITRLEEKRAEGKFTTVTYEYDLETVFNAIKFVMRHSEDGYIAKRLGKFHTDYAIEEKAIYNYSGQSGIGVFLEPLSPKRTKVDFVFRGFGVGLKYTVESLNLELPYLLEHGEQAYREYTHQLQERWKK